MPDITPEVKKLLDKNNELMMKLGKVEEEIIEVRSRLGDGTSAEDKLKVNKMIDDLAKVTDDLNSYAADGQKRMDNLEQQIAKSAQNPQWSASDQIRPGKTIYENLVKSSPYADQIEQFPLSSESDVIRAVKAYGSSVEHTDGDFKKFVFANRLAGKVTLTSLQTNAVGSAGALQVPEYMETILPPPQEMITILDMLPVTSTNRSQVHWRKEKLSARVSGAAIQSMDFTGTGQGSALGESSFQFEDFDEEMRTFGHHTNMAYQILADQPQLEGYISSQMMYMVRVDLEEQIIRGTNKTGNSGDQAFNLNSLNAAGTAFDTSLISKLQVQQADRLDVLRVAKHQADQTYIPGTLYCLNRTDKVAIELLKDGEGRYKFSNNVNTVTELRPWGIPLVESNFFTEDQFFVVPMNFCELCIRKAWESGMSTEHSDNFTKLLITMRIYGRYGFKLYYPASIIKGTFATAVTG